MISESYIKDLLLSMGYIKKNHIYEKFFPSVDCYIKVDLKNRTIIYPEDRGMTISNRTTCNFSAPENFVVLECVTRLFDKGYRPEHLNLEKEWTGWWHEHLHRYIQSRSKSDLRLSRSARQVASSGRNYRRRRCHALV